MLNQKWTVVIRVKIELDQYLTWQNTLEVESIEKLGESHLAFYRNAPGRGLQITAIYRLEDIISAAPANTVAENIFPAMRIKDES